MHTTNPVSLGSLSLRLFLSDAYFKAQGIRITLLRMQILLPVPDPLTQILGKGLATWASTGPPGDPDI